jgi:hypothetical protein
METNRASHVCHLHSGVLKHFSCNNIYPTYGETSMSCISADYSEMVGARKVAIDAKGATFVRNFNLTQTGSLF